MAEQEPQVHRVALWLCDLCLDGHGGECHTPGCALWLKSAPDIAIRDRATVAAEVHEQYGVRWPGGEITRGTEDWARTAVTYHVDPAKSRWAGEVWLVRREVVYGDWQEVTDE